MTQTTPRALTSVARSHDAAARLRELLARTGVVRALGAHDAMSARLGELYGFEALWASGLGISSVNALPDVGLLSLTELLDAAVRMRKAAGIPVIADCDSGAEDPNLMRRVVREYEDAGVAAICIEDKQHPKRNSFRGGNQLCDRELFGTRIAHAKAAQRTTDFCVIARLESFIVGLGVEDALCRAHTYVDAGADAILVHSKQGTAAEIAEFSARWAITRNDIPLVAVPTTYPGASADELAGIGIKVVIYANQLLRAALRAMDETIASMAAMGSSLPVEGTIAPLDRLFEVLYYDSVENA